MPCTETGSLAEPSTVASYLIYTAAAPTCVMAQGEQPGRAPPPPLLGHKSQRPKEATRSAAAQQATSAETDVCASLCKVGISTGAISKANCFPSLTEERSPSKIHPCCKKPTVHIRTCVLVQGLGHGTPEYNTSCLNAPTMHPPWCPASERGGCVPKVSAPPLKGPTSATGQHHLHNTSSIINTCGALSQCG